MPIAKDEELRCTRTGQVLEDLKGESAFDLNVAAGARAGGDAREPTRRRWPKAVAKLLGRDAAGARRRSGPRARPGRDGDTARSAKLIFETEPGIQVPALLFEPGSEAKGPLVLYVHGEGKAADADGRSTSCVRPGGASWRWTCAAGARRPRPRRRRSWAISASISARRSWRCTWAGR